jgi:hypothetical protein
MAANEIVPENHPVRTSTADISSSVPAHLFDYEKVLDQLFEPGKKPGKNEENQNIFHSRVA